MFFEEYDPIFIPDNKKNNSTTWLRIEYMQSIDGLEKRRRSVLPVIITFYLFCLEAKIATDDGYVHLYFL